MARTLEGGKPGVRRIGAGIALFCILAITAALPLWLPWRALDAFLADTTGTRITDRTGALLAVVTGPDGRMRENLRFDEIPAACRRIFIDLEDARFFSHPGVDPLAFGRAVVTRLRGGGSGASTITMQLARIISPHPHTLAGKVLEVYRALQIECRLSKKEILSLYLDSLPFGRNARGVAAAARTYFDTDLAELDPAELLLLAVIPRNPSRYDPFDHPDALSAAAREAAQRKGLGIDSAEIRGAILRARGGGLTFAAPHFSRVVSQLIRDGQVHPRGGEVRTTLDGALNDFIQERVRFYLDRYASARVTNAAVIVIDNASGEVIGWVGSRDFSDEAHSGQVDGVLIRRQSASTLKPFLYARALETGWTPATLLPDSPIEFSSPSDETYRPVNFDRRSHGVVRLRTALASSLNVPAVFTLSRIGLPTFEKDLRALGFALPPDAQSRYGLGMAVGNAEVSLRELARAFSVFPRGGSLPALVYAQGQTRTSAGIYGPAAAWLICSILSDPSARATGFGISTYFRTPFAAMFKSGTSSEFTNLWCLGATPQYTVGAWAGNFDGRTVINKTGSIVPTQLVVDVLTRLTTAPREFARPAGIVSARIDTLTGMRATPRCPSTRTEYFAAEAQVPPPCTFHERPGAWASLPLESLLGSADALRILFPVDGQVFYHDPTVSASEQRIPVLAAARGGVRVSLYLDGRLISASGPDPRVTVAARRGRHVITARTADAEARAVFEVR